MDLLDIPVPSVYKEESADFRFFMKWFALALSKIQYDTEEFFDLFDPLRCPADLLWMLGDTMGYRYDSRMSTAFNRLVLVYFISMIRLKGSRDGLTLAAQVNLDQFKLKQLAEEKEILDNRLEDTSIPSNSIFIEPHVEEGYVDLVYFSDQLPVDVCTDYVRPVGMYMVPHAGVRYDAKMRLSIDARLTNTNDLNISIGPTHVGHYSADDYARLQRVNASDVSNKHIRDTEGMSREDREAGVHYSTLSDTRQPVWYRNSKYEGAGSDIINPGYRALYSLQLVNGTASTRSLFRYANLSDINQENVSVFDSTDGNTYDNDYFVSQSRENPTEYVPTTPMGTMGDAMVTVPVEGTNNEETK